MNDEGARSIGKGLAWLGFWIMIGLVNFEKGFDIKPKMNALVETVDRVVKDKVP